MGGGAESGPDPTGVRKAAMGGVTAEACACVCIPECTHTLTHTHTREVDKSAPRDFPG